MIYNYPKETFKKYYNEALIFILNDFSRRAANVIRILDLKISLNLLCLLYIPMVGNDLLARRVKKSVWVHA